MHSAAYGDRDHLPGMESNMSVLIRSIGVSKRFTPQEAIIVYEGIINSEKRYYDNLSKTPVSEQRIIDISSSGNQEGPKFIQKASYLQFSTCTIPNVVIAKPEQPTPRLHPATERKSPRNRPKNKRPRYPRSSSANSLAFALQRCSTLIKMSRSCGGHAHGGYKWPKYKFFSNGAGPTDIYT